MEELILLDHTFSEGKFKTNVDNIFVQLHMAVMMKDLEKVKHFLSEEVFQQYEAIVAELNSKHVIQMYDEMNVASTDIINVEVLPDRFVIQVCIKSRYMDYWMDATSMKLVRGQNQDRIEKLNDLSFTKKRDFASFGNVRKCQSCGASMDINNSGKCPYCGSIYDLAKYDWILTSIHT